MRSMKDGEGGGVVFEETRGREGREGKVKWVTIEIEVSEDKRARKGRKVESRGRAKEGMT